ncbi:hypothetical protein C0993_009258, partial [Termitomyces sp. T159_Od127]
MDPGIVPPGRPSSTKLARFFSELALSKRDTWTSIEKARRDLSRIYRGFFPATLEAFLVWASPHSYRAGILKQTARQNCGLRRINDSDAVTLACSKEQER